MRRITLAVLLFAVLSSAVLSSAAMAETLVHILPSIAVEEPKPTVLVSAVCVSERPVHYSAPWLTVEESDLVPMVTTTGCDPEEAKVCIASCERTTTHYLEEVQCQDVGQTQCYFQCSYPSDCSDAPRVCERYVQCSCIGAGEGSK